MANNQTLKQGQQQKAKQRLTPQQLLVGQVIEKPIDQLREFVEKKVLENPALETTPNETDDWEGMMVDDNPLPDEISSKNHDDSTNTKNSNNPEDSDNNDESHSIDDNYNIDENYNTDNNDDRYDNDVPIPVYNTQQNDITYGDTISFYDKLKEQMGEHDLDEQQQEIMKYLIGSLDSDGLLRKDTDTICDELAIYYNIDASTDEVETVLAELQQFDPAGVGAHNLRECLLLQIDRKKPSWVKTITKQIVTNYFDDLLKNHWRKLQNVLHLSDEDKETIQGEIRKLNPKPGSSLGEVQGFNIHQITPDFIVETNDDGTVTFSLNRGDLPDISVSETYIDIVNNAKNLSKRDREALPILRKDLESAKGLIDAIQQRQHTLHATMKAIIRRQYRFFQEGDEADLRPMILKDIADDTGLDISTISRVTNEKYAQTRWGIFRLRFFFTDKYEKDGEEMSTRKIKLALREIINHEDKQHPFTDAKLEEEMKKKGFPIARRTIVKYREQMKIPKSSLRRE